MRFGAAKSLVFGFKLVENDAETKARSIERYVNNSGLVARNQIVVETVVNLINGGPHNRSSEVRLLKKLIAACAGNTGGGYRGFLAKILINNPELARVSFEDGVELFEAAIAALPAPDRVLMHHKGKWLATHHKPSEALVVYREALATPWFPYSDSGESDANILTSMAAVVVAEIKAGKRNREEGKIEAKRLLERAKSEGIVNAHAVHVSASLALELVREIPLEQEVERLELVASAVGEIDKLAMLEDSPLSYRTKSRKSVDLLHDARTNLYREALHGADCTEFANRIWIERQHQDGFIIAARSMLKSLRDSGNARGRDYKNVYEFCSDCRQTVLECNLAVDPRLSQIQVETFYWWRIYRAMLSPLESEIEWTALLGLLGEMRLSRSDKSEVFFRFLQAYALAHVSEWAKSDAIFAEIRGEDLPSDILFLPRGFLLDEKGGKTTVQGKINQYAGRTYLEVEKFGISFIADKRDRWSQKGEVDHANILFTFAGPRAVHDS